MRYDGGHKKHDFITHFLGRYFVYHRFCPEVDIGLGVPRPKIYLTEILGQIRCLSSVDATHDLTVQLRNTAHQQQTWLDGMCGYILKKNSPSCARAGVGIENANNRAMHDSGIFAATVHANNPLLPLAQEDELCDEQASQPFLKSVLVYHHWRQLDLQAGNRQTLAAFHDWLAQLSTGLAGEKLYSELGQQIHITPEADMAPFSQAYLGQIMRLLQNPRQPDQALLTPDKFSRLSSASLTV